MNRFCWRTVLKSLSLLVSLTGVALGDDSPGHIGYIDLEGNLLVTRPNGAEPRKLGAGGPVQAISFRPSQGAPDKDFYTWPTWSPDGERLAAFRASTEGEQQVDGLYVFDVASARTTDVYSQAALRPIYGYWSPDGKQMALLLQTAQGFSLSLWPSTKSDKPRSVATGIPFFFDWSKDAESILVHRGNDEEAPAGHSVSLVDVATKKRQVLSLTPAAFGAPSWSPDGKWLAYGATNGEKGGQLMLARGNGQDAKPLMKVLERTALLWSPTAPVIAVATTDEPMYPNLKLIDATTGKSRTLTKDGAIGAFFWAPSGDRILYARRDLKLGDWVWRVAEVATGKSKDVARFYPSRPLGMVFQYFDQFALSHRLWAPDGKHFVFAGALAEGSDESDGWVSPGVYVVPVDGKAKPRMIANGHTAFWSPR